MSKIYFLRSLAIVNVVLKEDLKQQLFDQRMEIKKLYETIDYLQNEILKYHRAKNRGSIEIDLDLLANDVNFMIQMNETKVRLFYREGKFTHLVGIDDKADIIT